MKLFRDGLLIPEQKVPTFAEFSAGWWDLETCRYLKARQLEDPMSQGTIYIHKSNYENHIKNYFAKYRLDEITPELIKDWRFSLSDKDEKKKALKPKTINFGYVPHTKTKHNRNIPIPQVMRQGLDELLNANGGGYVFSENGGETPIDMYRLNKDFGRALERIGISHEDRLKRNLSFHAWRHFLNTLLRTENVADSKVSSVTGHLSKKMIEHYTHFDTRKFKEVRDVQDELLTEKKPEEAKGKPRKAKAMEKTESKNKATA